MSDPAAKPMTELKVTAHMMRLDHGLFCIVQTPLARHEPDPAGLPGVRLSLPPNATTGISIASFRPDGWLSGQADAAIVRVTDASAQLLVTVYQNIGTTDAAPRLQVIRLGDDPAQQGAQRPAKPVAPRTMPELVAHQQVKGDVGAMLGEWIGDRGSKRWIEGFMIVPRTGLLASEIEYQAVLGRGWLSPWSEGGSLCGSRGMALPILGLRVRLKGDAVTRYDLRYEATFVDGSAAEARLGGEPCEAASLSPLEAFRVIVEERAAARAAKSAAIQPPAAQSPAAQSPTAQPQSVQPPGANLRPPVAKPPVLRPKRQSAARQTNRHQASQRRQAAGRKTRRRQAAARQARRQGGAEPQVPVAISRTPGD